MIQKSGEILAIGGDDFLIPVEAVLLLPAQVAGAVIKFVDVDKAIALCASTSSRWPRP